MSRVPLSSLKFKRNTAQPPENRSSSSPHSISSANPSASVASSSPPDSRTYSTPRLNCDHGYTDRPGFILGMRFELPRISSYHGREVMCAATNGCEVWSPNSRQRPFFAGRMRADFHLIPEDLKQRRFDGFPGRFDPLEAPQYDIRDRSWLPFARRPSTVSPNEQCSVGYRQVCVEWSKGRGDGDRVNPCFVDLLQQWSSAMEGESQALRKAVSMHDEVWACSPAVPSGAQFRQLLDCRSYEDAVDLCAEIQSRLRERAAWISQICAMTSEFRGAAAVWKDGYPPADDRYIGVFINDSSEDRIAWLLSARVPVFIVHRYTDRGERLPRLPHNELCTDFLQSTDVRFRKSEDRNGSANVAARRGFSVTWVEKDSGIDSDLEDPHHDLRFSSSRFLNARIRARTTSTRLPTQIPGTRPKPRNGRGGSQLARMTVTHRPHPPPDDVLSNSSDSEDSEDSGASTDFGPRAVYPERLSWVRPPPVMVPATGIKWGKFELTSELDLEDGAEIFLQRSKSWRPEADDMAVWFDREFHRELYIYEDYQVPPGCLSVQTYGCPAPPVNYYEAKGQQSYSKCKSSRWMYDRREPYPHDRHARARTPEACDLPVCPTHRSLSISPDSPPPSTNADSQPPGGAESRKSFLLSCENRTDICNAANVEEQQSLELELPMDVDEASTTLTASQTLPSPIDLSAHDEIAEDVASFFSPRPSSCARNLEPCDPLSTSSRPPSPPQSPPPSPRTSNRPQAALDTSTVAEQSHPMWQEEQTQAETLTLAGQPNSTQEEELHAVSKLDSDPKRSDFGSPARMIEHAVVSPERTLLSASLSQPVSSTDIDEVLMMAPMSAGCEDISLHTPSKPAIGDEVSLGGPFHTDNATTVPMDEDASTGCGVASLHTLTKLTIDPDCVSLGSPSPRSDMDEDFKSFIDSTTATSLNDDVSAQRDDTSILNPFTDSTTSIDDYAAAQHGDTGVLHPFTDSATSIDDYAAAQHGNTGVLHPFTDSTTSMDDDTAAPREDKSMRAPTQPAIDVDEVLRGPLSLKSDTDEDAYPITGSTAAVPMDVDEPLPVITAPGRPFTPCSEHPPPYESAASSPSIDKTTADPSPSSEEPACLTAQRSCSREEQPRGRFFDRRDLRGEQEDGSKNRSAVERRWKETLVYEWTTRFTPVRSTSTSVAKTAFTPALVFPVLLQALEESRVLAPPPIG
ncbi:hypothetical protein DFH06DRAFT_1328442 [Mycena polygramma]|nr:hypothetical protein DFH06DRAFT_1328442 [Mycena polygramma]